MDTTAIYMDAVADGTILYAKEISPAILHLMEKAEQLDVGSLQRLEAAAAAVEELRKKLDDLIDASLVGIEDIE